MDEIEALKPERICISPGPCTPNEAGHLLRSDPELRRDARRSSASASGTSRIGQVFGGDVVRADRLMHGKTSPIHHDGKSVFAGLPNPFEATRYHSLIVKRETLPDCLEITAWTEEGEIMGLQHKEHPDPRRAVPPESILTQDGKRLLENFLGI